ncbi:ATP-binding protein, partial [Acidianus sp. RZ1]|uniref:ATP-binding protein n=1 Tax=Acidianus sp. RZ1 TaxID=1540082 RepID=UPI001491965F
LIVIEEAHNYFTEYNDFINRIISEVRKFGVGLCIVSQSPSSISAEILKNTNIKIIHSLKADIDKRVISDSLSLPSSMVNFIDKLDIGEAILSAPNIKNPIVVKIKKTF